MATPNNQPISRRGMMRAIGACGAAALGAGLAVAADQAAPPRPAGQRSALGLQHSPLQTVRVGMIGVGGRGMSLLGELLNIDGVAVTAVGDVVPQRVAAAQARVVAKGQPSPAGYSKGETDFENLCLRDDVDLVYVATPWEWHAAMAVCAMNGGKHVAIEVPAAITLQECWDLVDASERTQRHCLMLENCCYGETEMFVLNMVRQGVLGELTHGEAGYLHPFAAGLLGTGDSSVWRRRHLMKLNGNLYPTHGLGPMALYLDIHGGDRFDYLVSMSSCEKALSRARDALPADDPRRQETYACGDVNTSLIKTALGRSILVQFDLITPRPYSRINSICGTGGTFADYPPRLALLGKEHAWETDLTSYMDKYGHPLWKQHKEQALKSGGHGGMDYLMNWRLIQCLRAGSPLDMTVYDAAAWSSIFPLSVASVAKGSSPVSVPDFTRGQWQRPRPLLAAAEA
jgi:predicted dehydrogenase